MKPVLFELGPLTVYSWGFAYVLAFLVAGYLAYQRAQRTGINPDAVLDLVLLISLAALLGSRVLYVALDWKYYQQTPWQVLAIWEGGLSFYGGLIAGILAGWGYAAYRRLPFTRLADLVAPLIAMGYAIVRVGCFLNGCCYGHPTDLPIGVNFFDVPRHPTQLYAAAAGLVIYFVLVRLERNKPYHGYIFLMFLGLYSLYRFLIEFWREAVVVRPPFTLTQVFAFGGMVSAFGLAWWLGRMQGRRG
ncbi:MAG: prolipoprotein diacylglyceryl transferase [Bacillota bacterium]